MVRRKGSIGEALVWCRECSGYARCRWGPKLMNRCKPENTRKMKVMTRNLKLEEGEIPDRSAKGWKVKEAKKKSHQKERKRQGEDFDVDTRPCTRKFFSAAGKTSEMKKMRRGPKMKKLRVGGC